MRSLRVSIGNIEDLALATGGNREFRPTLIGPGQVTGRLALSRFGGLTLTHGNFHCDIHVSGTLSNEKMSFAVLLPGTRNVNLFGKAAQPGDLVVVGEGQENDARYRSDLEYVIINVDRADVVRMAESEDLSPSPGVLDGSEVFSLRKQPASRLVKRMTAVSEALQDGSLQAIGPEAERLLADELVLDFLRCLPGARRRNRLATNPRRALPKLVRPVEDWLAGDPSRRPSIREISRVFGISSRQLFRAFHAEVGASPAQYLKRHRMTRVRFELLAADPTETSVTAVVNAWGFWELGRFAVEYRRMFGESPSQTLRTCPGYRWRGASATSASRAFT